MSVGPIEVPSQIRTRVRERVIEQVNYSKSLANGRPGDFLLPFLNLTVFSIAHESGWKQGML